MKSSLYDFCLRYFYISSTKQIRKFRSYEVININIAGATHLKIYMSDVLHADRSFLVLGQLMDYFILV